MDTRSVSIAHVSRFSTPPNFRKLKYKYDQVMAERSGPRNRIACLYLSDIFFTTAIFTTVMKSEVALAHELHSCSKTLPTSALISFQVFWPHSPWVFCLFVYLFQIPVFWPAVQCAVLLHLPPPPPVRSKRNSCNIYEAGFTYHATL